MKDSERAELACTLARKEGESRYKYGQATFNFQFKVLANVVKKGYMESRNDWRRR